MNKNELLILKWATLDTGMQGIFDYENNSPEEFKKIYGLTMGETDKAAKTLRAKTLLELIKKTKNDTHNHDDSQTLK